MNIIEAAGAVAVAAGIAAARGIERETEIARRGDADPAAETETGTAGGEATPTIETEAAAKVLLTRTHRRWCHTLASSTRRPLRRSLPLGTSLLGGWDPSRAARWKPCRSPFQTL